MGWLYGFVTFVLDNRKKEQQGEEIRNNNRWGSEAPREEIQRKDCQCMRMVPIIFDVFGSILHLPLGWISRRRLVTIKRWSNHFTTSFLCAGRALGSGFLSNCITMCVLEILIPVRLSWWPQDNLLTLRSSAFHSQSLKRWKCGNIFRDSYQNESKPSSSRFALARESFD